MQNAPTRPGRRLRLASLVTLVPMMLAFRCDPPAPTDAGAWPMGDGGMPMQDAGEPATDAAVGTESCVVYEIRRRECYRNASANATVVDIHSCEPGDFCERPRGRSESLDHIMCVDSWRYQRRVFPATCDEIADYQAGRVECLTPNHCAGGADDAGDWICDASRSCACPSGGRCPTPGPPPVPDAGVSDAGMPDAGPGGPTDSGPPPSPDAGPGGPPDSGPPPSPDAGPPAPPTPAPPAPPS